MADDLSKKIRETPVLETIEIKGPIPFGLFLSVLYEKRWLRVVS